MYQRLIFRINLNMFQIDFFCNLIQICIAPLINLDIIAYTVEPSKKLLKSLFKNRFIFHHLCRYTRQSCIICTDHIIILWLHQSFKSFNLTILFIQKDRSYRYDFHSTDSFFFCKLICQSVHFQINNNIFHILTLRFSSPCLRYDLFFTPIFLLNSGFFSIFAIIRINCILFFVSISIFLSHHSFSPSCSCRIFMVSV